MCLNEFTVALLILARHALSFEVHMVEVGSAPHEDRGRDLGLKILSSFICRGNPGE